jgi:hypothetical protein
MNDWMPYIIGALFASVLTGLGYLLKRAITGLEKAVVVISKEIESIHLLLTEFKGLLTQNEKDHNILWEKYRELRHVTDGHHDKITILETEHRKNHGT